MNKTERFIGKFDALMESDLTNDVNVPIKKSRPLFGRRFRVTCKQDNSVREFVSLKATAEYLRCHPTSVKRGLEHPNKFKPYPNIINKEFKIEEITRPEDLKTSPV